MTCGLDVLGAGYTVGEQTTIPGGFSISDLFKGAGEIAQRIDTKVQTDKAQAASAASASAKLGAITDADAKATEAIAQALYSAYLSTGSTGPAQAAAQAKASADQLVAQQASAVQDAAAQGAPQDVIDKRVAATQAAFTKATVDGAAAAEAYRQAPTDTSKRDAAKLASYRAQAAQATAMKAASAQIVATKGRAMTPAEEAAEKAHMEQLARDAQSGFFGKSIIGPVRVWHLGVGGLGALGAGFLWKRFR